LWNFTFKLSGRDLSNPEHLQALTTMTGTKDEEWFYMISVAAEARGGPLVAATLHCMEAMHNMTTRASSPPSGHSRMASEI